MRINLEEKTKVTGLGTGWYVSIQEGIDTKEQAELVREEVEELFRLRENFEKKYEDLEKQLVHYTPTSELQQGNWIQQITLMNLIADFFGLPKWQPKLPDYIEFRTDIDR